MLLATGAATAMFAVLAPALADVSVYENDFGSRAEFKEVISASGGKRCDRRYRKKGKEMVGSVRRGNTTCSFRPPVEGDSELPNHIVTLDAKVLKKTRKAVRRGAFLELTVRAGGEGSGYSFRIFPKRDRFELRRGPSGDGFPVQGKDKAIKGIHDVNKLRLAAKGATIEAFVNGTRVASVNDGNPGQVAGSKIRFAVGNAKGKSQPVFATFKKIAVAVP